MQYELFDKWCTTAGLITDGQRAAALFVTPMTIRNWRRKGSTPFYITTFCIGYNALLVRNDKEASEVLAGRRLSAAEVRDWMSRLGLENGKELSRALGMTKQAVSLWFRQDQFPRWIEVAFHGMKRRRSGRPQAVVQQNICIKSAPDM